MLKVGKEQQAGAFFLWEWKKNTAKAMNKKEQVLKILGQEKRKKKIILFFEGKFFGFFVLVQQNKKVSFHSPCYSGEWTCAPRTKQKAKRKRKSWKALSSVIVVCTFIANKIDLRKKWIYLEPMYFSLDFCLCFKIIEVVLKLTVFNFQLSRFLRKFSYFQIFFGIFRSFNLRNHQSV